MDAFLWLCFQLGMPQAAAKRKDKTCVCFYSFFHRNFGHLFAMYVSRLSLDLYVCVCNSHNIVQAMKSLALKRKRRSPLLRFSLLLFYYFDVTQRPNFNNFEQPKLNDTPINGRDNDSIRSSKFVDFCSTPNARSQDSLLLSLCYLFEGSPREVFLFFFEFFFFLRSLFLLNLHLDKHFSSCPGDANLECVADDAMRSWSGAEAEVGAGVAGRR